MPELTRLERNQTGDLETVGIRNPEGDIQWGYEVRRHALFRLAPRSRSKRARSTPESISQSACWIYLLDPPLTPWIRPGSVPGSTPQPAHWIHTWTSLWFAIPLVLPVGNIIHRSGQCPIQNQTRLTACWTRGSETARADPGTDQ